MRIDLVCRVVDNFGDIAVTWRLARALLRASGGQVSVRLLLDDWDTFRVLVPELPASGHRYELKAPEGSVTILRSTSLDRLGERSSPADVLVEAFGAPTPVVWLEPFLAEAEQGFGRLSPKVILHLEYTTAEPWSEEYHLLPSPVGRPGVERWFFVPGFRPKTGGLIFPGISRARWERGSEDWLMSVFSYEHNYANFWNELGAFLAERNQSARVIVFRGRSYAGAWESWSHFRDAYPGKAKRISFVEQAFLTMDDYAALLDAGDFHIVRGEASWVDALLAGRPFLWHAYLQEEGFQRVKVEAFLEVSGPWFEQEGQGRVFEQIRESFLAFNTRTQNSVDELTDEHFRVFWENSVLIGRVLKKWSDWLRKNADLGAKMLEFLDQFRL